MVMFALPEVPPPGPGLVTVTGMTCPFASSFTVS